MVRAFLSGGGSAGPEGGLLKPNLLALLRDWPVMIVGAFSFWSADIVYHYVRKSELSGAAIWEMTAIMPLLALMTYATVLFTTGRRYKKRQSVAISMLLGIWCWRLR